MTGAIEKPEGAAGVVADSVGNWVDRYAPAATRPYLRLARADRPIGTWLLLLPGWWSIALAAAATGARWFDLWLVVGFAIGSFLMRGAGCTWNDITDRNIDGLVERTRSRPIPSGQVSVKQALAFMALQMAISALVLVTFNPTAIAVALIALAPVAVYPFAKRFTWWPQVFLGVAFNWGALLGWVAHTGTLDWPAVILYLSGILWTLFYDTIYAHQDKEDDALIGVKSTARLFGEDSAKWLGGFLIGSVGLMTIAVLWALLPAGVSPLILAICLGAPVAFGMHMLWQMHHLDIDNPGNCLWLFRSNRNVGLIVALFIAAGAIVQLILG